MTLTHEKYAGMTRREVEVTTEMAPPDSRDASDRRRGPA